MATTADFKNGLVIDFNNDLYTIIEFQHVKPGKGGAFVRSKLKSLTTGRVLENTFNAGVKINIVNIEKHQYQYLFKDDTGYVFMNTDNFEQITVNKNFIENPLLLVDNCMINILIQSETNKIVGVEFPAFVEMTITSAEPGVKGNTATRAMKNARTESGLDILVPLFIEEGDKIKVDTRTGKYVERVSK